MLIGYCYPGIIVQGGDGAYSRHHFKHLGAHNLCLFSGGALAHQRFT